MNFYYKDSRLAIERREAVLESEDEISEESKEFSLWESSSIKRL
jgi:hypothetical protein